MVPAALISKPIVLCFPLGLGLLGIDVQVDLREARDCLKFRPHVDDHIAHANLDLGEGEWNDDVDFLKLEDEELAFVEHDIFPIQ